MKNVWKLSNYFFSWMMKKGGKVILCGSIVFGGLLLLANAFPQAATELDRSHFPKAFLPYEEIIDSCGIPILFLAGLVVLFVMIFWQAKSFYINNKGIYTLLTLPLKREQVYFSFLLSGMAILLLYFMAWLILIVAAYFPIMASHTKVAAEEIFYVTPDVTIKGLDATRTNGLYLAFQRSLFLYTAFPTSLVRGLSLVSGLLLILTGILYAGLHYAEPFAAGAMAFAGTLIGGYTIILALLWRIGLQYYTTAQTVTGKGIVMGILCVVLSIGVVFLSVKDIRKKYVA